MRKLVFPLLVLILASAAMMYSQNMPGILCSGGGIACVIPGASFVSSTNQLQLPGSIRLYPSNGGTATYSEIVRQDTNGYTVFNEVSQNAGWQLQQAGAPYLNIAGGNPGPTITGFGGLYLTIGDSASFLQLLNTVKVGYSGTNNYVIPVTDNLISLGNQTNRWSSVNSVGVSVTSMADSSGIVTFAEERPTSCTGDGCVLVAGAKNSAGKITTTTTGASAPVIAFSTTFAHAPACFSNNETTANLSRAISTTTQVTISGVTVSGDTIKYICAGF
jgi:hypothetical protein